MRFAACVHLFVNLRVSRILTASSEGSVPLYFIALVGLGPNTALGKFCLTNILAGPRFIE